MGLGMFLLGPELLHSSDFGSFGLGPCFFIGLGMFSSAWSCFYLGLSFSIGLDMFGWGLKYSRLGLKLRLRPNFSCGFDLSFHIDLSFAFGLLLNKFWRQ